MPPFNWPQQITGERDQPKVRVHVHEGRVVQTITGRDGSVEHLAYDPALAETLARQLVAAARQARSG